MTVTGKTIDQIIEQMPHERRAKIERLGDYYADYSLPSRAELGAHDPELAELFNNSKVVTLAALPQRTKCDG